MLRIKQLSGKKCITLYFGLLLLFVLIAGCSSSSTSNKQVTTPDVPNVKILSHDNSWRSYGGLEVTGVVQNDDNVMHKVGVTAYCYDQNGVKVDDGFDYITVDPYGGKSTFSAICTDMNNRQGTYKVYITSIH
jgi:hypothetical protein